MHIRLFPFAWAMYALFFTSCLFAQTDDSGWTLTQENEGVQVFIRPQGEGLMNDIKGVVTIAGDIDSAFKVLSDLPTFSSTDPLMVESVIIQRNSPNEYYVWERGNMPFFMHDRDVVSKVNLSQTSKGGYIMATQTVPDFIPRKPGLVRAEDISVVVSLRPVDLESFELIYKLHVGNSSNDGKMINTIANKAVVTSTMERLKRLRELVRTKPLAGN